jgi:hypothetical protein
MLGMLGSLTYEFLRRLAAVVGMLGMLGKLDL